MHGASSDWGAALLLHFILLGVLAFCACVSLLLHGLSLRATRWPPMWFAFANLGFSAVVSVLAIWLSAYYMAWFMWAIRSAAALLIVVAAVSTYVRARRSRTT